MRRLLQILGSLLMITIPLGLAFTLAYSEDEPDTPKESQEQEYDCDPPAAVGWLTDAKITVLPSIDGLGSISGIAYWPEASTEDTPVFVAIDDDVEGAVFRITLQKKPSTSVTVNKEALNKETHNPESITYLGNNRFAIAEERRQRALVVSLDPKEKGLASVQCSTDTLDGGRSKALCKDDIGKNDPRRDYCNSGIEGISFDGRSTLYIAQEKHPKRLFWADATPLLDCTAQKGKPEKEISFPTITEATWIGRSDFMSDVSDLLAISENQILLLSQECSSIVEVTRQGEPRSTFTFHMPALANLEGIAWDGKTHLYLVGETSTKKKVSPFVELTLNNPSALPATQTQPSTLSGNQ